MSRPLRIEYPGAWYHVMNRGRRSERIFYEEEDYLSFIELLKESTELWGINIYAFVLMPNHYHMLINTPLGNLSRFMRHVDGVYTQRFNKFHKLEGALFKGRYKSILVEFDSYFLQLVRYIHRNPIRSKLVEDMDNYSWSSHQNYINNSSKNEWINKNLLLSMLPKDKDNKVYEYRKFIGIPDEKNIVTILKSKRWPSFLGSAKYIVSMKDKYFLEKRNIEIPDSKNLSPEVEIIKEIVCNYYNLNKKYLCTKKRKSFNEPRNIAIYLSRYLRNDSLNKICEDYLLGSHTSASRIISSVRNSIFNNVEFENIIAELIRMIVKCQVKI